MTARLVAVPDIRHPYTLVLLDQIADQQVMCITVARIPGIQHPMLEKFAIVTCLVLDSLIGFGSLIYEPCQKQNNAIDGLQS